MSSILHRCVRWCFDGRIRSVISLLVIAYLGWTAYVNREAMGYLVGQALAWAIVGLILLGVGRFILFRRR